MKKFNVKIFYETKKNFSVLNFRIQGFGACFVNAPLFNFKII